MACSMAETRVLELTGVEVPTLIGRMLSELTGVGVIVSMLAFTLCGVDDV